MMRREDLEEFARRRPFQPFEVRLVDGERFRLTSIERFVVGRNALGVLDRRGVIVQVSLGLIATIRPIVTGKARRGRAS